MAIKELKLHEDEQWNIVLESEFGKSFFVSKSAPTTAQHRANLEGIMKRPLPMEPGQKRRKYEKRWVIRKPSRQQGAAPKISKTITLPEDLVAAIESEAEKRQTYFSSVIEETMIAALQP